MEQKNEYFIIFGGGGIRGLTYCGAFKALLENSVTPTGFAGSSIGAVFAALVAVGYSYQEIFEILCDTGFSMFIDINIDLKKELAFSKGKIFLDWIREKIEKKFYKDNYKKDKMAPVNFSDIKKELIIFSVDLTNLKFMEFSSSKTPDFEIAQAVRASVSMPGLFTPLELGNSLIVDGDLLKSSPLWRLCDSIKNKKERILEFRLEDNETPKKITNSLEYLNRVYNALSGFATDYVIDLYKQKDKFDYIKINTPDVCVVDFLIPKEKRKELFEIGFNATNEYFKNYFPFKRKSLLEKYEKLFSMLLKFQNNFRKNKHNEAYLSLCEIFVFLCEEKMYFDSSIYEQIKEFKGFYLKSSDFKLNNSLFSVFFKTKKIKDKESLNSNLFDIIKSVSIKICELKD